MRLANGGTSTDMGMHRDDLADFLRRSRGRLSPRDVGLVEGPRRRTPGLRREEVAALAGPQQATTGPVPLPCSAPASTASSAGKLFLAHGHCFDDAAQGIHVPVGDS